MKKGSSIVVVGTQFGDEGKGKVVDLFSSSAKHIARAQGGNNAGHTIIAQGKEYKFHLIPSGILYPSTQCYIGGSVVVDPQALLTEMKTLQAQGVSLDRRLFLSSYAHLVFPYHKILDRLSEEKKGRSSIGTTGKGIGPCYVDKVNRSGIRVADLISSSFSDLLHDVLSRKNEEIKALYGHPPLEYSEILKDYLGYAKELVELVAPVEEMLYEANERRENILFEGAQGTFLDITFGTYPFVTSSCTLSGGVCSGLGLGPSHVGRVVGVTKAYMTRVGHGPLPTELSSSELALFPDHTTSREIGTTTGRKRRLGWFDAFLVRHAIRLNGVDSLAVMKLDILDDVDEILICTGYKHVSSFPTTIKELSSSIPVYERHPGWKSSTKDVKVYHDLPAQAKAYLRRVEELCKVPIGLISVGPERERTIWLDRFFEESL